MSLPKIDVPIYTMKLPSNGQTISFRPYSVKEEKILLLAAESDDVNEMTAATRQIINNCILEPDFNCIKLPIYDIDYAFMQIRSKSVGNIVSNDYVCTNKVNDITCGQVFNFNIKIEEIELVDPKLDKIISIDSQWSVKMRHPTFETIMKIKDTDTNYDKTVKTLMDTIESVFDETNVFLFSDNTDEERLEFIEGLRKEPYDKMKDYIENTPHFKIEKSHKCVKCGFVHHETIEDPIRFF